MKYHSRHPQEAAPRPSGMARLLVLLLMLAVVMPAGARLRHASSCLLLGCERDSLYLPLLSGRRVALFSNQTGVDSHGLHTLDRLLASGVRVTTLFGPEHGFRGTADAGEHVSSSVDEPTGIPIRSLYDGGSTGQIGRAHV